MFLKMFSLFRFSFIVLLFLSQLVLPINYWVCSHPLEHGEPSKGHTLQENCLLLSQQLLVMNDSWVRVGTSWPPPYSMGGFCLACARAGLVYVVTTAIGVHAQLPCIWKTSFHCSHPPPMAKSFCPVFYNGKKGCDIDVPFRVEYSVVLLSAPWLLWVSVLLLQKQSPIKFGSLTNLQEQVIRSLFNITYMNIGY